MWWGPVGSRKDLDWRLGNWPSCFQHPDSLFTVTSCPPTGSAQTFKFVCQGEGPLLATWGGAAQNRKEVASSLPQHSNRVHLLLLGSLTSKEVVAMERCLLLPFLVSDMMVFRDKVFLLEFLAPVLLPCQHR